MTEKPRQFDLIILGAGAAGLFCAAEAAHRGRRVAILDHNAQPGRKILISGGGRCNFTHLGASWQHYDSQNPRFAASALSAFSAELFLERVNRARIPWHEKSPGQLFCNHSARQILDLLLDACASAPHPVEFIYNARNITLGSTASPWLIDSSAGCFQAEALVLATGGLSIPKLGATSLGYDLARQLSLRIVTPRPGLVPLKLSGDESHWHTLAGLSTEVEVRCNKHSFRDQLLITHRGLSGPAILQISTFWQPGQPIALDLLPTLGNQSVLASLKAPRARRDTLALRQLLRPLFPQRMADHLAERELSSGWSNNDLAEKEQRLRHWLLHPSSTEGFEKAEVTAGGIDTRDLNAKTLATRSHDSLFCIGELVDVTGQLGGYNFQWAWSSAFAAAHAI